MKTKENFLNKSLRIFTLVLPTQMLQQSQYG